MSLTPRLGRRTFVAGSAAAAGLALTGLDLATPAMAQSAIRTQDWQQLVAMVEEARRAGVSTPLVSVPAAGSARFEDIIPALVDLIDDLDAAGAGKAEIAAIKRRARNMLTEINRRERPLQRGEIDGGEPFGWLAALVAPSPAYAQSQDERWRRHRATYAPLFDTCRVRPERVDKVEWYVSKIMSERYRSQYEKLEESICVPWYVIGVMHALEATFNFDTHLHNGDPLTGRTFHVPAGRPAAGSPPFEWAESARDALEIKKYINRTDWHVASTLFRIEAYNGFRSRELYNINTPYLWSFSNHYTKGKFVADNRWDSNAVSGQCGAAVILKVLTDRKVIQMIS